MISRQIYGDIRVKKYYAEKHRASTSIQIQPQQWEVQYQLSMEGVTLEYFDNYNMIRYVNSSYEFYSQLSEDNKHNETDTHAHMMHI